MKMATKNFLKLARTDSFTWTSVLMASNAFECLVIHMSCGTA